MWAEVCALLPRWRCPRLTGCCHSWKRWAAPVATSCPTPQLQSALLAWSTRDHWVSLCSRLCPRPVFLFCSPPASDKCNGLGSTGDSLDRLIRGTVTRVCSELDSASSPLRTQAFTLIIWVRLSVSASGSNKLVFSYTVILRYRRAVNILNNSYCSLVDTTADIMADKIWEPVHQKMYVLRLLW